MEIKGKDFTLRTWCLEDAPSLQRNADNPHISAYLLNRFPSPYSLQDAEDFIALKMKEPVITNFAIAVNGEVAGVIGLDFRQDVYSKTPLLGYWLAEQYWGQGIVPDAIKLITAYGFNVLDVICIMACVFSKNTKSMRVLEKAGYQKQGVIKRSVIKHNEIFDEHIYAAYNSEIFGGDETEGSTSQQ